MTDIRERIEEETHTLNFKIDRYVKLHIQPKPWYLPEWLWRGLLKRLLVLEEFNK